MAFESKNVQFVVNYLPQQVYNDLLSNDQIDNDQLYMTQQTWLDANNQNVKNVLDPVLSSDGTNKNYVDQNFLKTNDVESRCYTIIKTWDD